MTDAPERITWFTDGSILVGSFSTGRLSKFPHQEYIRATCITALEARVKELEKALVESCIVPEALMISGRPRGLSDEAWTQMLNALRMTRAALQKEPHDGP